MTPANLTWRRLTADQLTRLYETDLCRDFPASERKPLAMILAAEARGSAHSWGVFEGENLAAYLLMVRPEGCPISHLDYFAVLPDRRAGGLGAQLLAQLPAHEPGARAIVIEAEWPEKAEDEAMAHRRLGFYARAGAVDTGWTEHLFDAWFRVLVLPCPGQEPLSGEEALHQLALCYHENRQGIADADWKKLVRFYRPDGTEERFGL